MDNYVKQNDVWDKKAEKLYEIQRLKSHYTKLASKLSSELVELSGGQNCVGKDYVFHAHNRKGAVDYKSIPELKVVDLELYRKKDTVIWKLENAGEGFLKKIEDYPVDI
jgi:hypothetical protein